MQNIYIKRIKEVDIYEKQCYSISRKEKERIPPGIGKDRREARKMKQKENFWQRYLRRREEEVRKAVEEYWEMMK